MIHAPTPIREALLEQSVLTHLNKLMKEPSMEAKEINQCLRILVYLAEDPDVSQLLITGRIFNLLKDTVKAHCDE